MPDTPEMKRRIQRYQELHPNEPRPWDGERDHRPPLWKRKALFRWRARQALLLDAVMGWKSGTLTSGTDAALASAERPAETVHEQRLRIRAQQEAADITPEKAAAALNDLAEREADDV